MDMSPYLDSVVLVMSFSAKPLARVRHDEAIEFDLPAEWALIAAMFQAFPALAERVQSRSLPGRARGDCRSRDPRITGYLFSTDMTTSITPPENKNSSSPSSRRTIPAFVVSCGNGFLAHGDSIGDVMNRSHSLSTNGPRTALYIDDRHNNYFAKRLMFISGALVPLYETTEKPGSTFYSLTISPLTML
jgi:hypothetical protein